MDKGIFKFLVLLLFLTAGTTSCKKKTGCYDEVLYEQHKHDACLENCPGVTGCDGKTYCNECYALRQGIKVE